MAVTLPPGLPREALRKDAARNGLTRSRAAGRILRTATAAALAVWFVLPLVPLGLWVFADRWSYPAPLPQHWGLENVDSALSRGAATGFAGSLALGLAVSALATPLGVLAARSLAFHPSRWSALFSALLFAPLALPAFVTVFGLNVLLVRLQVPSSAGVVLVLTAYALPYTTYVMRLAFGAHDLGFEEEACTLGATRGQVFLRVQLPLIAPALARAAFLAFLVGWSDYLVTVLIGGGSLVTVPLLVASAAAGTGNDGIVAVLSLIALAPPLALLLFAGMTGRRRPGARP
ncbi:ABC transporter permease [Pseudarthrobacter enclensis]|uniref:Spermidine/putrescine transport system permease protein n=1 Tax=Pseudarthrobacter enclensis TaxID=993070 RepID=A0ABT9RY12_9MICC|nr:ABC transporter permease subunit [Pseudarthrobacter enclensis]MDP9890132.1 putative spermidine/putrescine transport system permease protein [Pseudarthrobacter enclensis]